MNYDFLIQIIEIGRNCIYTLQKNLNWMKVWIERYKECHGNRLSWKHFSKLVRESRRSGDFNVTQREIDLAYGLKDVKPSKFTHFI